MEIFSEVYDKSVDLLRTRLFGEGWQAIEDDLRALLDRAGPNVGKADTLEALRRAFSRADGAALSGGAADEIIKASRTDILGFQDRIALLKTMRHFYMVERKGGQSIWVFDPPKSYSDWTYDQLNGKTVQEVKSHLQNDDETFGESNRHMMADAVQLARKWAGDLQFKLADGSARESVRRWFHGPEATEDQVAASNATLLEGFKQIQAACNSNLVVFSDHAALRTSGGWDNAWAAVHEDDRLPVIYVFQVFLQTGRRDVAGQIPKLWECALTVVHELSHKIMKTEDIRYEYEGLNPGCFGGKRPLSNAESWAYFAADLTGSLSPGICNRVLR